MKLILSLFRHPIGIASSSIAVPLKLIHVFAAVYLLAGAFAFQYLYPKLLDKLPMLGTMRKLAVWKEKSLFSLELYGYGLLICLVCLAALIAVYALAGLLQSKQLDHKKAYLAGVVSSLPFFVGLIAGSFILYPIHHYLGLLPMYGLLVSCCLQGAILTQSYALNRTLACYLVPALMGLQCYLLNLVRP